MMALPVCAAAWGVSAAIVLLIIPCPLQRVSPSCFRDSVCRVKRNGAAGNTGAGKARR